MRTPLKKPLELTCYRKSDFRFCHQSESAHILNEFDYSPNLDFNEENVLAFAPHLGYRSRAFASMFKVQIQAKIRLIINMSIKKHLREVEIDFEMKKIYGS